MTRIKPDPDCPYCGGTGEISTMERVYADEPHMAMIGSHPCHCVSNENENEEDEIDDDIAIGDLGENESE
jgi:hypothetical protein